MSRKDVRRRIACAEGAETEYAPMMIVLSLSWLWEVSMEGIVPDMARGRVVAIVLDGGGGEEERREVGRCWEESEEYKP